MFWWLAQFLNFWYNSFSKKCTYHKQWWGEVVYSSTFYCSSFSFRTQKGCLKAPHHFHHKKKIIHLKKLCSLYLKVHPCCSYHIPCSRTHLWDSMFKHIQSALWTHRFNTLITLYKLSLSAHFNQHSCPQASFNIPKPGTTWNTYLCHCTEACNLAFKSSSLSNGRSRSKILRWNNANTAICMSFNEFQSVWNTDCHAWVCKSYCVHILQFHLYHQYSYYWEIWSSPWHYSFIMLFLTEAVLCQTAREVQIWEASKHQPMKQAK